ncbi:MAG: DUF3522 domain-containing protein [Desulfosporosinus sp.]|nr:DUF3522 domain-containing protein [Desulfosporosinus sp.]
MVEKLGKAMFLVMSNLLFALPAWSCYYRGTWAEGALYTAIIFISSMFHYTDNFGCLVTFNDKCYGERSTFYFMDRYVSFSMIITSITLIVFPTTTIVPQADRTFNAAIKSFTNVFSSLTIIYLMMEDSDWDRIVVIVTAFGLLYLLIAVVVCQVKLAVNTCEFVMAWVFLTLGLVSYVMDAKYTDYYWILHSFWHIFMAITIFLVSDSKNESYSSLGERMNDIKFSDPDSYSGHRDAKYVTVMRVGDTNYALY